MSLLDSDKTAHRISSYLFGDCQSVAEIEATLKKLEQRYRRTGQGLRQLEQSPGRDASRTKALEGLAMIAVSPLNANRSALGARIAAARLTA